MFTQNYTNLSFVRLIEYSASIWGFKSYSCINAVQNRAMRVFLGIGKYTPTAALHGELGGNHVYPDNGYASAAMLLECHIQTVVGWINV